MVFFSTVETLIDNNPEPDTGSQSRALINNPKSNQNFYFSYLCYIYKFGYSLLKNSIGYLALPGTISQLNQLWKSTPNNFFLNKISCCEGSLLDIHFYVVNGAAKCDNINQTITMSESADTHIMPVMRALGISQLNRIITITVITLRSFHSTLVDDKLLFFPTTLNTKFID